MPTWQAMYDAARTLREYSTECHYRRQRWRADFWWWVAGKVYAIGTAKADREFSKAEE